MGTLLSPGIDDQPADHASGRGRNIEIECQIVDLFSGQHLQEPYAAINPNHQVPLLVDGDFYPSESSAILKYLAEKFKSQAYPTDLTRRARVNERMDWFNTGLYRDLGYGLIYPHVLDAHRHADDSVHTATLARGREKAKKWLAILGRSAPTSSRRSKTKSSWAFRRPCFDRRSSSGFAWIAA